MNDPLDENVNYVDPSSVSPRPIAMRYGLIWGLVGILLGLTSHMMGWSDQANPNFVMSAIMGLISLAVTVGVLVMAIKQHRDQDLGGYATFGRAFSTGFLTTLVYSIIATIWMVVLMNFIAPEMFLGMEEKMIEQWEAQGMSDSEIETALGYTGMFTGPVAMTVMTFIGSLVWGAILSLIIAAVLKKDPPRMA